MDETRINLFQGICQHLGYWRFKDLRRQWNQNIIWTENHILRTDGNLPQYPSGGSICNWEMRNFSINKNNRDLDSNKIYRKTTGSERNVVFKTMSKNIVDAAKEKQASHQKCRCGKRIDNEDKILKTNFLVHWDRKKELEYSLMMAKIVGSSTRGRKCMSFLKNLDVDLSGEKIRYLADHRNGCAEFVRWACPW